MMSNEFSNHQKQDRNTPDVTTLGNLFRRAGNQRAGFLVTDPGNKEAPDMGTVFLLENKG